MKWSEFRAMLSGISPDTAIGRIIAIRSENDKDVLKNFTKEQKRIRSEWMNRKAKKLSTEDMEKVLDGFKQALLAMAEGR